MPLYHHREAAMQKDYVHVTISLLAMLLRTKATKGDYSITLLQNLTDTVIELEDVLIARIGIEEKIHEADGGYKQPVYIINSLARLEYCICLTFLKEPKILSVSLYGSNDKAACNDLQTWIHIDHLKQMFASTEEQMVEQWEKKVLIGLSTCIIYQDIADNNINHDMQDAEQSAWLWYKAYSNNLQEPQDSFTVQSGHARQEFDDAEDLSQVWCTVSNGQAHSTLN
ncbi:hypothetical protein CY34DRAFT_106847 [Suillus luteus UH-Slu-Lm8-n1]|uniref:Uncharacterized protein n=1 Tax=Suillus luteus UH-Slu-Lm8-n1 TaxID=930992 RepID=A0A0D0AKZ4_9AGAM|nr:hypothetical protein CY34DRAFT_106847 [Suillus luteus UH-Slu-Lm8-n1]